MVWLAYTFTFGAPWLWARRVVPGELLVCTTSRIAAGGLDDALSQLRRRSALRLHRVLEVEDLVTESYRRGGARDSAPVAAAWWVRVRPGTEQAALREIEYRVAVAMARKGEYEGIGRRGLLAVGRAVLAANQVRKAQLSWANDDPGPVLFDDETHEAYRNMIGLGAEPTRAVSVAVLDSAVRISDVPQRSQCRIEVDYSIEPPENRPPFAHGAVTTSLICDIADNASVCVYPVVDPYNEVSEASIVATLTGLLTKEARAEVVVLCLGLTENSESKSQKSSYTALRRLLQLLDRNLVVVVATGNTGDEDLRVLEPAPRKDVYAIGAVNRAGRRPRFSRFVFPETEQPALYLLAPGGDSDGISATEASVSVHGVGRTGSSVAAAYAAGVVTRALGTVGAGVARRDHVTAALRGASLPVGSDADAGSFCHGLIRQPPVGWQRNLVAVYPPSLAIPLQAAPTPGRAETVLVGAVDLGAALLDPAVAEVLLT